MTKEEIIKKITFIDRTIKYDKENDTLSALMGRKVIVNWEEINNIFERIQEYECTDNSIGNKNYYEILVMPSNNDRLFFLRRDYYLVENGKTEISIGEISDELALHLFSKLEPKYGRITGTIHRQEDFKILDVIKNCFRRNLSIKIKSLNGEKIEDIHQLINSFLFNLAYKKERFYTISTFPKEYSLKVYDEKDDSDLDFPRKAYNEILTKYYIHASSVIVESAKYLTYYNVLEYNFVDIYEEEICKKIQNIVTSPDFSYKNTQHFKKILKEIPKNYKKNNVIDELDALKLTIKKYVTIEEIKNFISEQKYKFDCNNILSNTKKDIINILDSDEQIIAQISNRVYSIRNAIVHSKNDGININYIPLKHDDFLEQEMPLIKFLAQKVIINSGKTL